MPRKSANKAALTDPLLVALDDGSVIDLHDQFTWLSDKLTVKRKKFVFYYAYPFTNRAYHVGAKSARQAGYEGDNEVVKNAAINLLQDSDVRKEIANITDQVAENMPKYAIKSAIPAIIAKKMLRAGLDATGFHDFQEVYDEDGNRKIVATIKTPDSLTEEQRAQVIAVEIDARGNVNYKLADPRQEENDLLKYVQALLADVDKGNEYDVESTAEIIKGELKLRTKIIRKNEEIARIADFEEGKASGASRVEED